jgi:hypothetical protein
MHQIAIIRCPWRGVHIPAKHFSNGKGGDLPFRGTLGMGFPCIHLIGGNENIVHAKDWQQISFTSNAGLQKELLSS